MEDTTRIPMDLKTDDLPITQFHVAEVKHEDFSLDYENDNQVPNHSGFYYRPDNIYPVAEVKQEELQYVKVEATDEGDVRGSDNSVKVSV